jgi:hypothetical protein
LKISSGAAEKIYTSNPGGGIEAEKERGLHAEATPIRQRMKSAPGCFHHGYFRLDAWGKVW